MNAQSRWHAAVAGLLVAVGALASPALAEPAMTAGRSGAPATAARPAKFVGVESVDVRSLLAAPEADASALAAGERELVAVMNATAGAGALARARDEDSLSAKIFADVLGPGFAPAKCPKVFALLREAALDARAISDAAKDVWSRPRPPREGSGIEPAVPVPTSGAYPSGHATRAYVWGEVMAAAVPSKAGALRQRARLVGLDRVLAGVHYPSDVAAGFALGRAIFEQMARSEAFGKELAQAQAELAALAPDAPQQPAADTGPLPPADAALKPLAFLAGRWVGVNPNKTVNREHWMAPSGKTMSALFMQVRRDGDAAFYEVSTISAEADGVRLYHRHLHTRLAVDDRRKDVEVFTLVSVSGEAGWERAVFKPVKEIEGGIETMTYRAQGPDKLVQELKFRPGSKEKDFSTTSTRER